MKTLGSVQTIELDITKPVQMKEMEMQYNKLLLLLGANGTGKTFLLKITWVLSTFVNHLVMILHDKISTDNKLHLQYLLDNTFTNNDLTGKIYFTYERGNSISVELLEGKVIKVGMSLEEDLSPSAQPVFMSKETRLFSDIIQYMKIKNLMKIPKGIPVTESDMNKVMEMYRIYDMMYIETLLHYIETKTTPKLIEDFGKQIVEFDPDIKITDIRIDYTTNDILYSDGINYKSIGSLGAGHQALINMFLFQHYQKS